MTNEGDLNEPRLYTRAHLYSALKLSVTVVDPASGRAEEKAATGFAVLGGRTRRLHLVSNRHVFDPPFADPRYVGHYVETLKINGVAVRGSHADEPFEIVLSELAPRFPEDDVLDVGAIDLTDIEVPDELIRAALPTAALMDERSVLIDEVGVGSEIVMAGYPRLETGVGERPILVPGLVSSDLHRDAEYGGTSYPGRGMCHAFSRGGMSGSPLLTTVFDRSPYSGSGPVRVVRILGVNTGHPRERYGPETLSLFVPAWIVARLVGSDELPAKMDAAFSDRLRRRLGLSKESLETSEDDRR